MPCHPDRVRRHYTAWQDADRLLNGPRCVCGAYPREAHAPECPYQRKTTDDTLLEHIDDLIDPGYGMGV